MRLSLNFLRLALPERALMLRGLAVVAATRAGLSLIGYRRLRALAVNDAREDAPTRELARIAWAVRRAAKWVPAATCLTQALAAQIMLARAGYRTSIRVGVAPRADGRFEAHAWLMSRDTVVIGDAGHDLGRFTVMADLSPSAP
jgi:hypothetical protein